jgi:ATP-dependent protease ClpP protease subunit
MASYYGSRAGGLDLSSVRAIRARGNVLSRLPELDNEPEPVKASALAAFPGNVETIPHRTGLHISVDGELYPGLNVDKQVKAISEAEGKITVRVNCGGGDLRSAFRLHDALKAHGPDLVEILIAGLCGSAATIILAASNHRRCINGSTLWVHQPSDVTFGTGSDHRRIADLLDDWLPRMAIVYGRIIDPCLVDEWLSSQKDYIFSASEALAVNLVNAVEEPVTP